MPRALALETSGRTGSVAAVEDGAVVAEDQFPHGLQHAAGLVPMIDRLCLGRGWAPADVEEIYVSAGPGSFTGLRVGVTVAKTMALATGARVVAVPTADALARNAPAGWQNLVIVLDAKRDQIFTATFARGDGGEPVLREPARLDSLAAVLARTPRPMHLLGEGIPYHEKFLPANEPSVIVAPPESWRARAGAVAEVGYAMARRGEFVDPDRLTPVYVRRPEAEEKFEERVAQSAGSGSSAGKPAR
jgi:tRNA threonylcarbamoyladenosine biosynthesis protein TsaB